MSLLSRFCLALARVLLAAWVGAATLFVVNGVRLVTSPQFDSVARDQMTLIRFPSYYLFGMVAVVGSLVCLMLVRGYPHRLVIGLVIVALLLMILDYVVVYRPLEQMISPPGQPRSSQFESYHRASMMINAAHVGLCLLAVFLLSIPKRWESAGDN